MTGTTVSVIALLLATSLVYIVVKALRNPLRNFPGPWHSLFTHYPLKIAVLQGRRLHYIHALHVKYGPIVRAGPDELAIADTNAFKIIHKAGLTGFPKHGWYIGQSEDNAKAVFNMIDNREHNTRRRMLAPGFTKTNIVKEWEPVVQANTKLLISKMRAETERNNGNVDVLKWVIFYAADVSATVMFGESFELLNRGERNKYVKDVETIMIWGGLGYEFPLLRFIAKRVPLPFHVFQQLANAAATLHEYGGKAVAASRLSNNSSRNVFKTMIADAEKGLPELTDADVAAEAGNLQVAGTDTTACTLTFLLWAVAKRPDIQAQLVQEVAELSDGELNDARLSQLPLLDAVIQEALRLYPAVGSSLLRSVPRGGAELCGYSVPEGTAVGTTAYTMHRLVSLWGADVEEFRPERWLPDGKSGVTRVSDEARVAFHPFGGMSRGCLGRHLAMLEIRTVIAMFYREFGTSVRVAEETTDQSMELEDYFVISPKSHRCILTMKQ